VTSGGFEATKVQEEQVEKGGLKKALIDADVDGTSDDEGGEGEDDKLGNEG